VCAVLRAGVVFALGMQVGIKQAALRVLPRVMAALPLDVRLMLQPPCHNLAEGKLAKKGIPLNERGCPWDVSLGARFLSYAALAWAVSTAPAVFRAIEAFVHSSGSA
jgi:hypothetical protein